MGQHCAGSSATQRTLPAGRATGAARYIGRVGALAVALGVGAAVASGAGIARADDPAGNDPGGNSGGVQSPAADSVAGDPTDSAAAGVTPPAGASHGVKLGKTGLVRLPQMLQNNSGGAHSSTVRRGARSDDTTGRCRGQGPRAAAQATRGLGPRPGARRNCRASSSLRRHRPDLTTRRRSRPLGHRCARPTQNTDGVATRVRAVVQDTVTALHQPSGTLVGKPLTDSAAALVHTDDSTLNRHDRRISRSHGCFHADISPLRHRRGRSRRWSRACSLRSASPHLPA